MGCEMATIKLPDDLDDRRTTSELVLSLRKHFHSSHFTKVADILSSREGRMKREIEEKRKENESLLERIINLEVGRLNMICLEDELRQSKNECSELKKQVSELLGHQIKVREVEDRLARVLQRVRCQVDGGMGSSGGENQGGDLKAEGSLDATASVAGGEKVGDDGKLDVIMDVKKENQELENGGDVGIGVGNANLTADHGGCMMDQLEVGSQGTTAPNSAKVIIDIPDSDDESTPCKPAPKEGTTQSLLEPGPSGEHRTHMLKRKWSDTGTNDDNSSREDGKKITRVPDLIPRSDGETTSAQQKLGFPPSSSHDKKTTAAGQSSDRKSLMDLACKLDADDSSSSSSGSGFDINEKFSRVHRPETQKCGRAARSTFSECGNSIPFLEVERLVKICLEDELRQSKNECSKLKQQVSVLLGHEIKVKEVEDRLARVLLRVRCQVDGGMGSSGGENQGGDLMTEGSIEATASVAGEKKVDEASKLDVKKENGGASGLGMDQLGAGSQGTTTPKSAKVIIDIPDSDDEFTPPKAAPKEVSARPHLEPGLSGEDETHVLKRKMTDTGTNDNNSSRDKKKITRVADSIPGNDGETTSAQQKLDSPPSSIQDKETMDAEQFADELFTWDMASMFDVDPSSSPSSSSDFDCIDLDLVMHILEGLNGKD